MSHKNRRERILQIIETIQVSKQDELAKILNDEGYSVTQSTVSRDINELKLIKVKTKEGKSIYAKPKINHANDVSDEKVITLLKTFLISVENAKNLVVVKTLAGHGPACGMAIDKLKPEGVVGCIAGDDTSLIVAYTDENAEEIVNYVKEIIK